MLFDIHVYHNVFLLLSSLLTTGQTQSLKLLLPWEKKQKRKENIKQDWISLITIQGSMWTFLLIFIEFKSKGQPFDQSEQCVKKINEMELEKNIHLCSS